MAQAGIMCRLVKFRPMVKVLTRSRNAYYLSNTKSPQRFLQSPLISSVTSSQIKMFSRNPDVVVYEEVKAATQNSTVYIVDVREPAELQEKGQIPNSLNIPLGDVSQVLGVLTNEEFEAKYGRSKPDLSAPIIFSCQSGKRAANGSALAVKLGFTKYDCRLLVLLL